MLVNRVIWHEENTGTIWEISHQCCIMRKVIHKEVTTGGRFDIILDTVRKLQYWNFLNFCTIPVSQRS